MECVLRFKPVLTVRRCFLRMYMMKPHILDVTLRKVRMPSKHCRVFSMLTSTLRPPIPRHVNHFHLWVKIAPLGPVVEEEMAG